MTRSLLHALAVLVPASILVAGGPCAVQLAHAQSSDRDERSESREDRRESWRGRFGGRDSSRWRDSRRDREESERRDDDRSDRSESSASSTTPSASSREASSAGGQTSMNMTDYVRSLVKQHDKDGDNMLKGDERSGLRGRAASADLNNDGVITIDELVAHLSSGSSPATSGGSSRGDGESSERRESDRDGESDRGRERFFSFRRGDRDRERDSDEARRGDKAPAAKRVYLGSARGSASGESEKNQRRTYRFTPPRERLPKDLPSFFAPDANGDGQISMHEFSRTWSQRTVDEFRRYDRNDDGVITPKEAAAKSQ